MWIFRKTPGKFFVTLIIAFILLLNFANAQLYNLCGIWYTNDFPCNGPSHLETFAISHSGMYVIATKIIGDDCVTSGHISWEGEYHWSPFQVTVWMGAPLYPNYGTGLRMVTVIDSSHLVVAGYHLYKYTCGELDKLHQSPLDYDLNCDCHKPAGDIQIGPTPFYDVIEIRNNSGEDIKKIYIFNSCGQLIFSSESTERKINLELIAQGVYTYSIVTESGRLFRGKILKL